MRPLRAAAAAGTRPRRAPEQGTPLASGLGRSELPGVCASLLHRSLGPHCAPNYTAKRKKNTKQPVRRFKKKKKVT